MHPPPCHHSVPTFFDVAPRTCAKTSLRRNRHARPTFSPGNVPLRASESTVLVLTRSKSAASSAVRTSWSSAIFPHSLVTGRKVTLAAVRLPRWPSTQSRMRQFGFSQVFRGGPTDIAHATHAAVTRSEFAAVDSEIACAGRSQARGIPTLSTCVRTAVNRDWQGTARCPRIVLTPSVRVRPGGPARAGLQGRGLCRCLISRAFVARNHGSAI